MPKRITKGNLWGFIQSRPYASVADIRRLFMMDVDGAASLSSSEGVYYIGLPQEGADLIRQLWVEGRIILDLNPDVKALVVQGVYPARIATGRFGGRSGHPGTGSAARGPGPGGRGPGPTLTADDPDGTGRRRKRRKRRSPEDAPVPAPTPSTSPDPPGVLAAADGP